MAELMTVATPVTPLTMTELSTAPPIAGALTATEPMAGFLLSRSCQIL